MPRPAARSSGKRRYTTKAATAGYDNGGDGHLDDEDGAYEDPRDAFGNQSLPVAELPLDFDGVPLDGEQYLATVRLEAASHPSVFYAAFNPYASQDDSATVGASGSGYSNGTGIDGLYQRLSMPSKEWRESFLIKFRNMRESLSNAPLDKVPFIQDRLPKPGNADGWYTWIHGKPPPEDEGSERLGGGAQGRNDDDDDDNDDDMDMDDSDAEKTVKRVVSIKEPSGGALRRLSTDHVLGILEAFPHWLAQGIHLTTPHDGTGNNQAAIDGARFSTPAIHPLHARWMFALLAWLEPQLVSEQISVLRTLARACISAIRISRIRTKALESRKRKAAIEDTGRAAVETVTMAPSDSSIGEALHTGAAPDARSPPPTESSGRVYSGEVGAWMVIAAIAGIWGQTDLWDDAVASLKKTAA